MDEIDVLKFLATTRNANASFPLSLLDIFLEGLTDIGRKVFFSPGMCWDLAELLLPEDSPTGAGMGPNEHEFLDLYLRILVQQHIAHIDFSDIITRTGLSLCHLVMNEGGDILFVSGA